MVNRPFPSNPSYVESIRGLHRLHALTLTGGDHGPEADLVRDSLDDPWLALSETERLRVSGLSGDLYSISDPPEELLPITPQARRGVDEALAASKEGKWDEALELLRAWGRYVDPAALSLLRGAIWHAAGDDATAALFLEHASHLYPEIGPYATACLSSLARTDPKPA